MDDEKLVNAMRQRIAAATDGKPHLQHFCSDACIRRYLKARSHNIDKASQMLLDTLDWREHERMHEVSWNEIKHIAATGKVMRVQTRSDRPILLLRPRMDDLPKAHSANIRHFCYHVEMASRMADRVGQDGKQTWIVDFTGFRLSNQAPLATSLEALRILQNHYPERLHEAILWHPPTAFRVIWKAISPFMDKVTKEKTIFLMKSSAESPQALTKRVDVEQLDASMGGKEEDVYDFAAAEQTMLAEEEVYRSEIGLSTYQDKTDRAKIHQTRANEPDA